ncbi:unnamed protein product [Gemmata massiliana]|uniref:Uncharacterized protein n=1 Tax=Gemmata massiliana TaxID=1210884 RepID=A0A6P2DBU5_9BACT|nr:hypothetical protein [Gemmata massiliana]VTR97825.1 unnamed protein product [Gemmata massiliana]
MIKIGQREYNPADIVGVSLANGQLSVTRTYRVPTDRSSPPTETVPFTETVTFTGPNVIDDYRRVEHAMMEHYSTGTDRSTKLVFNANLAGYVPDGKIARPIVDRSCAVEHANNA